jgi:hypothetical protein
MRYFIVELAMIFFSIHGFAQNAIEQMFIPGPSHTQLTNLKKLKKFKNFRKFITFGERRVPFKTPIASPKLSTLFG